MEFKILHRSGKARRGKLTTPHGAIETPNFLPVGTLAAVKGVSPKDLGAIGVQVLMTNTYHLNLQPGEDTIQKLGGLHKFMNWDKPLMTDSGGFQVFSLGVALEQGVGKLLHDETTKYKPRLNKITEEGVEFQSHLDGSRHILTPESSIQIQAKLGADLMVAFDDLESPKYSYQETLQSLELTERWGLRSLREFRKLGLKDRHLLYGVTHGGIFKDLRIRSAKFTDENFDGIALGGAHKDRQTMYQVIEWTMDHVSEDKPRHLLGVGEVEDLLEAVLRGVDLFDCVAPTRRARNGSLYVSPTSKVYSSKSEYRKRNFTINIRAKKFANDPKPFDPSCSCSTCQNFSRAYLNHLYRSNEILYHQLATIHNLAFIINLMKQIRLAIRLDKLEEFKKEWLD